MVGSGGVGSAIAASLAKAGVSRLGVFDAFAPMMDGLASRLRRHYPSLDVVTGSKDPAGFDVVVNATPLGMKPDDPLPVERGAHRPRRLRRRGRHEDRDHPVPRGGTGTRLRLPGGDRHALRADRPISSSSASARSTRRNSARWRRSATDRAVATPACGVAFPCAEKGRCRTTSASFEVEGDAVDAVAQVPRSAIIKLKSLVSKGYKCLFYTEYSFIIIICKNEEIGIITTRSS